MGIYAVVPVICVIIASAFLSYFENDTFILAAFLLFCIFSAVYPAFLFFLPLIIYDLFFSKWKHWMFTAAIPFIIKIFFIPPQACIFIILFTALSYLIKLRTRSAEKARSEYIALRDTSKEISMQLESKNKELMEKQDYEISLATLNERNRIARDIHDSDGHVLSNSILQTGAIMATCKDEAIYERLNTLKETLVTGMNSIRESIHDLYDDSVDLYAETRSLTEGFDFCELYLDYDVETNPDIKTKYALLYVMKEALSNIIKHSNATHVSVTLKEHPALFQLVIKDNGAKKDTKGEGIGLFNIEQRVHGLGGNVNIGYENGFTVFVSIPKERAL
jgi:signal transduction histidine kinase